MILDVCKSKCAFMYIKFIYCVEHVLAILNNISYFVQYLFTHTCGLLIDTQSTLTQIHATLLQEKWGLFSEGGARKLCQDYNIPLLGTIPLDPVS